MRAEIFAGGKAHLATADPSISLSAGTRARSLRITLCWADREDVAGIRSPVSAGVAEAGADAVDGGRDGSVEFCGFGGVWWDGTFAADEFDLDEGHGVDVGIAEADGALEDGVLLEERGLLGDLEDHAVGEVKLGFEGAEDAVAEGLVFDEGGVEAGDAEVGLGQGHFYIADDVDEEGEVLDHGAEEGEAVG